MKFEVKMQGDGRRSCHVTAERSPHHGILGRNRYQRRDWVEGNVGLPFTTVSPTGTGARA
jgi:hypothetical protein